MSGQGAHGNQAWLGCAAQVLILLFAVYVFGKNINVVGLDAGLQDRGQLGGRFDFGKAKAGVVPVLSVQPGQALDRAGVAPGDLVHFSPAYQAVRRPAPNETVPVVIEHSGQLRPAALHIPAGFRGTTTKQDFPFGLRRRWLVVTNGLALTITTLLGAFIVWRSRRRQTILLLGASLLSYGMPGYSVASQFPSGLYPFLLTFDILALASFSTLLYAFALAFYRDHVGRLGNITKLVFWTLALWQFGANLQMVHTILKDGANVDNTYGVPAFFGFAGCVIYLFLGWRRSVSEIQQRYAFLLTATGAVVLAQVVGTALQPFDFGSLEDFANNVLRGILVLVACGLFTYSILHHKVFDLGFAVNRTLVYGAVSAILLVGFGLIEWASEHFISIEAREKNVLIDAGVALGVFLTFHRLRDWVENFIERLFFHSWHERETALRRFVAEAGHVFTPQALNTAFVQALTEFADGAPSAVYWRGDDDRAAAYQRLADYLADTPPILSVDDAALIQLRHERGPISPPLGSCLFNAALVLPMTYRNDLIGFACLGPKPTGLEYRPDEKDLLGYAAQQIGLDLHALRVEALETNIRALQTTCASLEGLLLKRSSDGWATAP